MKKEVQPYPLCITPGFLLMSFVVDQYPELFNIQSTQQRHNWPYSRPTWTNYKNQAWIKIRTGLPSTVYEFQIVFPGWAFRPAFQWTTGVIWSSGFGCVSSEGSNLSRGLISLVEIKRLFNWAFTITRRQYRLNCTVCCDRSSRQIMEDYNSTDSTLNDGFISPTRLVVPNPVVRLSNALLRGSLGPNTQHRRRGVSLSLNTLENWKLLEAVQQHGPELCMGNCVLKEELVSLNWTFFHLKLVQIRTVEIRTSQEYRYMFIFVMPLIWLSTGNIFFCLRKIGNWL